MSRILITSISRKYSLYSTVYEIAETLNADVFVTDKNERCLGAHFPSVNFLRQTVPGVDGIIQLARDNSIDLVIPSRDEECRTFTSRINEFKLNGCDLLTPRHSTVELCLNKEQFNRHLECLGLCPLPLLGDPEDDDFPIFMRPKSGAGSVGCIKIDSRRDFENARFDKTAEYFIHPFIDDNEYSVDVIIDSENDYFDCVIRKRMLVQNGESQVTETADIPAIKNDVKILMDSFGDTGHFVVQVFYSGDHGVRFIETNPRFGGASTLSQYAGLNSLKYLIYKKLDNECYRKWTSNVCSKPIRMTRLSHDHYDEVPNAPPN